MAEAVCVGSERQQSCFDSSGNAYSVSKLSGDVIKIEGYNSRTGSTWNSVTMKIGNTTYLTGSKDGKHWTQVISDLGGMTYRIGRDSNGNTFSQLCYAIFGCDSNHRQQLSPFGN